MKTAAEASGMDRGATMVEFALLGGVVIFAAIAAIDLGVALYLRACAESAAHRAISQASVDPRLSEADQSELAIDAASDTVKRVLRDTTFVNLSVNGSGLATLQDTIQVVVPRSPTLKEALRREPIRVTVPLLYRPLTPFLSRAIPISVTAQGYYEEMPAPNVPPLIDCAGEQLLDPTKPPKLIRDGTCACPPGFLEGERGRCSCPPCALSGAEQVPSTCACRCPEGARETGGRCVPVCPPGFTNDAVSGRCICPLHPQDCGNPAAFSLETCSCSGDPACRPPFVAVGDRCECDPNGPFNFQTCDALHRRFLTATCECQECPPNLGYYGGSCVSCPRHATAENGLCVCPSPFVAPNYFTCECPYGAAGQCNAQGKRINPDTCRCEDCLPPQSEAVGEGCQCPSALMRDCNARNLVLNATTCQCQSCPPGQGYWYGTCHSCNIGQVVVDNVCRCTAPLIEQGSTCVCPQQYQDACTAAGAPMDPLTCACLPACVSPHVPMGNICTCPLETRQQQGQCAAQNAIWNEPTCRCVPCPEGSIANGTSCVPCPGTTRPIGTPPHCGCPGEAPTYPGTEYCRCPDAADQACARDRRRIDPATCECGEGCPFPKIPYGPDCGCDPNGPDTPLSCRAQGMDFSPNSCRCAPCRPGTGFNGSSCQPCRTGEVVDANRCVCPSPKTIERNECVCPAEVVKACNDAGQPVQADCSCACTRPPCCNLSAPLCAAQGMIFDPATCSCQPCPRCQAFDRKLLRCVTIEGCT